MCVYSCMWGVGLVYVNIRPSPLTSGVFALMNAYAFLKYVQFYLTGKQFQSLLFFTAIISVGVVIVAVIGQVYLGYIAPWKGRFYSLYDTRCASYYSFGLIVCSYVVAFVDSPRHISNWFLSTQLVNVAI